VSADGFGESNGQGSGQRPAVEIEFKNVSKIYGGGGAPAISDLSLKIPAGETCCLVGPSGGGKTTAMKLVNRLIDLTSGDILIGGKSVMSIDATTLRRDIGYVIQQVGLFPHMTIGANISLIPKMLGWRKERIGPRVEELLDLVRLDRTYAKRYPGQLSGGQQQRVGLARALAADPPVMLMDEPFGALDPITRSALQDEFLGLETKIKKTVIFVTHDIDEAIKMGDKIAVLREGGVLAQYGTADELLSKPADEYVADFVGADRGLKRLSLRQMSEVARPATGSVPANAPSVSHDSTLRVGLSVLFASASPVLAVTDDDGNNIGTVTIDQLQQAVIDADSSSAGEAH
jgi:osmoprotectant transport system ATP-binding protein